MSGADVSFTHDTSKHPAKGQPKDPVIDETKLTLKDVDDDELLKRCGSIDMIYTHDEYPEFKIVDNPGPRYGTSYYVKQSQNEPWIFKHWSPSPPSQFDRFISKQYI